MYLKTRKFSCVRAHIGNLINYMRTDTKDLLTNRFGGNGIKIVRLHSDHFTGVLAELRLLLIYTNFMFEFQTIYLFDVHSSILKKIMVGKIVC